MRLYRLSKQLGKPITSFNSREASFARIVDYEKTLHIGCIFVGPSGLVGAHEAPVNQLFLVLNGEGWVVGREGTKVEIRSGMAAYWEAGEQHESGSEQGMTVLVLEGEELKPLLELHGD
ncbi:cupin [Cohnella sp. AR92]|uniref:cupin n=1 Tax=Cohnella sp. AR92 TaxID=648716 RepID=UPI000F8C9D05|nr:cupin [Cohnella sp. AR92]RUS46233.1 cupin [Cohnella sp. AR92]